MLQTFTADTFALDNGAFAISGNAGVAAATVDWVGPAGINGGATADSYGNYIIPGLDQGDYTLTPRRVGYKFTPPSRTVKLVQPDGIGTITTGTLPALGTENDSVVMSKTFMLFQLVATSVCRVRLYSTAAARAADANRSNQVPPTPGTEHGVIGDFYLDTPDKLTWMCSPIVPGFNNDGPPRITTIYAAITNLGAAPAAITVTLYFVQVGG